MDGRLDRERKIEESINRKLESLPQYVADWNKSLKASRKTAATRKDFIFKVDAFLRSIKPDAKSVLIKDISEQAVVDYMLSVQTKEKNGRTEYTSDSYQKTIWSCLNNFLGYLCDRGKIKKNYMTLIDSPKNHDLDRINEHRVLLTIEDFKKILSAVDEEENVIIRKRDKAVLLVFMNTGMRRAALSSITLDDIDLENGVLTVVDKGNKRHQYFLNKDARNAITEWLKVRQKYDRFNCKDHLFLSEHGNALSDTTLMYMVNKYTKRALNVPLSPHKLRAGYCSILYNETKDIEFVRRAVGHSSTMITQRYIVTKGDERYKAAEIMKNILT